MTIALALGFSILIMILPFVAFAVLAITDQDNKVDNKNYSQNKFPDPSHHRK